MSTAGLTPGRRRMASLWFATRTGRRLHLVNGHGRDLPYVLVSLCGREVSVTEYVGSTDVRAVDRRRTCKDCQDVAAELARSASVVDPRSS